MMRGELVLVALVSCAIGCHSARSATLRDAGHPIEAGTDSSTAMPPIEAGTDSSTAMPGDASTSGWQDASWDRTRDTDAGGTIGADGGECDWTADNRYHCVVCEHDATCDAPRYTDNHDGTVSSSCCGLVWQQGHSGPGFVELADARAYCAALSQTLPGKGWRLPTMLELQNLLVLGQTPPSPAIDRVAFPDTPPYGNFRGEWPPNAAFPFVVNFDSGAVIDIFSTNPSFYVRCVR